MSAAIFLSLFACGFSTAAVVAALWIGERIRSVSDLLAAAAAGVLIVVATMHIGPEAVRLNAHAIWFIATGFGLAALVRTVSRRIGGAANAYALLGGVALHSFADGLILAVAASAGDQFLTFSAAGLVLHEAPEGVICYIIAQRAGLSPERAAVVAIMAGGGATLVGTLLSEPAIAGAGSLTLAGLMGLSAGLLAFSAISIVLARPVRRPVRKGLAVGAAALVMAVCIAKAPPHDHGSHAIAGGNAHAGHNHRVCEHAGRLGAACPNFSPLRAVANPRSGRRDVFRPSFESSEER
jgi:ZIP family zinc transporter